MVVEVIVDGDSGASSSDSATYTISFPLSTGINVSSIAIFSVDNNIVALESDADSTFSSSYVGLPTTDASGGTGTSSYGSLTSSVTSSITTKNGTKILLKDDISFTMIVDSPGLVNPSTASTTTPAGTSIPCTFSFSSTQTKLRSD